MNTAQLLIILLIAVIVIVAIIALWLYFEVWAFCDDSILKCWEIWDAKWKEPEI